MKANNTGIAFIGLLIGIVAGFALASAETKFFFRELRLEISEDLTTRLGWSGACSEADDYDCQVLNGGAQILCVKGVKK